MSNHPEPPVSYTWQSKDTQISLYNSFQDFDPKPISLEDLLSMIRDGYCQETIEQLRLCNDSKERDKIKKSLPAVTLSGLFNGHRKAENLLTYSGLIQIDFDKVECWEKEIETLKNDPYTLAAFISPSGTGIKLVVRVEDNVINHKENFKGLQEYYLFKYGLNVDKACKDISRLMFLSYDPDIWVNFNAVPWGLKTSQNEKFQRVQAYVERSLKFTEGHRNEFIFKIGLEAVKQGFDIEMVKINCLKFKSENFNENEINRTIESAYSYTNSSGEISKDAWYSKIQTLENKISGMFELRNNEILGRIEFRLLKSSENFKELNENELWRILAKSGLEVASNRLTSLLKSEFVPKYNPFQDYFNSIGRYDPETEPDFIGKLCEHINCKDQSRFNIQFRKMLVRTVACSLDRRVVNKQAFILVQDKQNSGKSTFCRWLCPPELAEYIAENIGTDKDGNIALTENFIINLDELATLNKSEISNLKSLFSLDTVKKRLPYERRATSRPRCASFVGSTNMNEFLTDESGSVRWLCFEVDQINFNYRSEIDINNIWKQAYYFYRIGFIYQMTPEEIKENELANRKFQKSSLEQQFIETHFSPGTKDDHHSFVQSMQIVQCGQEKMLKLTAIMIGKAFKMLGYDRVSGIKGVNQVWGYYIKLNPGSEFTSLHNLG